MTLATADGHALAADLYQPLQPTQAVLISSGTGFPKSFYRHIARHFAAKGAVVLTYDYRGIGASRSGDLRGSPIEYSDWGRYDLPAALDALHHAAPGLPIKHVAHSVGGHFLGIASNHDLIHKQAFVSVGIGYWPKHHLKYIPLELYFWWCLGSYNLLRHGYLKRGGGWTGEDIPPKVFRTWRRWCHSPTYFRQDMSDRLTPQHYTQVTGPIRSWVFTDDPIATPYTAQALLDFYPNASQEITVHDPAEYGVKRIGHEGAFRRDCTEIWDDIWRWLA
jgi:predicted alpha/beta hydrolase